MAEISTVQLYARDVWAVDRHKAALAIRLLGGCLGIEAKPGFRIAVDDCEPEPRRPREFGECVFKDMAIGGESGEDETYQLFVVDEEGNALAESAGVFRIGQALDLLGKLPLRLSPHADRWLKDALGEPGPREGRATGNGAAECSRRAVLRLGGEPA